MHPPTNIYISFATIFWYLNKMVYWVGDYMPSLLGSSEWQSDLAGRTEWRICKSSENVTGQKGLFKMPELFLKQQPDYYTVHPALPMVTWPLALGEMPNFTEF